jgi:restriction system protein
MPIPDYQAIMLPLLQFAKDQKEHSLQEGIFYLTKIFNLTEEERNELLPSGKQSRFVNRIGWTRTHLKKAGLIEYSRRGFFKITERGLQVGSIHFWQI